MPFDYTTKGWPGALTLGGGNYDVTSCDRDDTGLVYKLTNGTSNPHVTIHGADKEGPGVWRNHSGTFHVVVSNTKTYEYDRNGAPNDFVPARKGGKGGTGLGDANQTATAKAIALDFSAAIYKAVTGT